MMFTNIKSSIRVRSFLGAMTAALAVSALMMFTVGGCDGGDGGNPGKSDPNEIVNCEYTVGGFTSCGQMTRSACEASSGKTVAQCASGGGTLQECLTDCAEKYSYVECLQTSTTQAELAECLASATACADQCNSRFGVGCTAGIDCATDLVSCQMTGTCTDGMPRAACEAGGGQVKSSCGVVVTPGTGGNVVTAANEAWTMCEDGECEGMAFNADGTAEMLIKTDGEWYSMPMSIKYTASGGIITTITTFSFMGETESDTAAISYSVTGNTLKTVDEDGDEFTRTKTSGITPTPLSIEMYMLWVMGEEIGLDCDLPEIIGGTCDLGGCSLEEIISGDCDPDGGNNEPLKPGLGGNLVLPADQAWTDAHSRSVSRREGYIFHENRTVEQINDMYEVWDASIDGTYVVSGGKLTMTLLNGQFTINRDFTVSTSGDTLMLNDRIYTRTINVTVGSSSSNSVSVLEAGSLAKSSATSQLKKSLNVLSKLSKK